MGLWRAVMGTIQAMALETIARGPSTSPRRLCITARRSISPPRHVLSCQFLSPRPRGVFRSTGIIATTITTITTEMAGAAKR